MNARLRRYRRLSLVPAAALGLLAYYVLVYTPLDRKAKELDVPLRTAWTNLAGTLGRSNALALDFAQITNQLRQTREDLTALEDAKNKAARRIDLPADVKARMSSPFQLSDYQLERSLRVESIVKLARDLKIRIDPVVLVGFPEHTADMSEPALLWPALHLVDGLLITALRCQVAALHALDVPMAPTNTPGRLAPIHAQLEFTAPANAATRLVEALPRRGGEELKAVGVDGPADKAPLYIERLIIRRQNPEKPDEVRVLLRVAGFVYRE